MSMIVTMSQMKGFMRDSLGAWMGPNIYPTARAECKEPAALTVATVPHYIRGQTRLAVGQ